MSWVIAGMSALGALKSHNQQQQAKKQDKFRKAAITYSPWTGMGDPGGMIAPDLLSGAAEGAASGALLSGALGGGEAVAPMETAGAATETSGMALGTGVGQQALTPEMQRWQLMNQAQGGPGYTMIG